MNSRIAFRDLSRLTRTSSGDTAYFPFHHAAAFDPESLGSGEFFRRADEAYEGFIGSLGGFGSSRLFAAVETPHQLWQFSRIGLMLADVVALSGPSWNGIPQVGQTYRIDYRRALTPNRLGIIYSSYVRFEDAIVQQWTLEAEALIEGEHLVYLPGRLVSWIDPIDHSFTAYDAAFEVFQELADVMVSARKADALPLLPSRLVPDASEIVALFDVAMPFIDRLPLKELKNLIEKEHHVFLSFRHELKQAIATLHTEMLGSHISPQAVAVEIRDDVINPAMAKINRELEKIVHVRSLRIGGAVLGTLAMGLAAATGGNDHVQVASQLLAAGGLGLVTKEYADDVSDRHSLRENPWYFLWTIKNRIS